MKTNPNRKRSIHVSRQAVKRDRDPIARRFCVAATICGVIVAAGFFLAARSHFSSVDYGFRNSELRRQIESLESDKRRWIYLRETAMAPDEIRKSARRIGMFENRQVVSAEVTSADRRPTTAPVANSGSPQRQMIQKTADVVSTARPRETAKPVVAFDKRGPVRLQLARN
jgi:hypothetical protein